MSDTPFDPRFTPEQLARGETTPALSDISFDSSSWHERVDRATTAEARHLVQNFTVQVEEAAKLSGHRRPLLLHIIAFHVGARLARMHPGLSWPMACGALDVEIRRSDSAAA